MEAQQLDLALRALAEALRSLADTTQALVWQSHLLGYGLILLTLITLAGFVWMGLELRTIRRMLLLMRQP